MKYNRKVEYYLSFFEQKKRGDDTITILKNNAPAELQESVHNAHGNRLPNDWIYDKYESILSNISGYDDYSNIDNIRPEIVDGLVDCYTSNLTEWLNDNNSNVYYISEALENFGNGNNDGFALLAQAQYLAIDEIFSKVASLLEKEDADNE